MKIGLIDSWSLPFSKHTETSWNTSLVNYFNLKLVTDGSSQGKRQMVIFIRTDVLFPLTRKRRTRGSIAHGRNHVILPSSTLSRYGPFGQIEAV